MDQISKGDKVRSFDFENKSLTGERACYVEGTVKNIVKKDGCDRYQIMVEKRVFGGREVHFEAGVEFVYPPVNGTPMMFGELDYTDFVDKLEGS